VNQSNSKLPKHLLVIFIIFSNFSFGKEFNELFTIYEPIKESSQIEKSINQLELNLEKEINKLESEISENSSLNDSLNKSTLELLDSNNIFLSDEDLSNIILKKVS